MAFNLENMTIDYKKMLRMIPSDRTTLAQSGAISDLISSLTPGQLTNLFPRYYRDRLPDVGRAVASGSGSSLGGALSGGTSFSGGGGTGGTTYTPPPPSKSAQELTVEKILKENNVELKRPQNAGSLDKILPGISKDADLMNAVNEQAQRFGVTPASIAMILKVENPNLNPAISGGAGNSYSGLFQIGPGELRSLGLSPEQYRNMTAAEQTRVWGNWLDSVNFKGRTSVESGNTNQNFTMLMANQLGSGRDLKEFNQNSILAAGQAASIGGDRVTLSSLAQFAQSVNPSNIVDIESAAEEIKQLEVLKSELIPLTEEIRKQLDSKTLEIYDNAGPEQKWNIEQAIKAAGVQGFNEELKRQPINETSVNATSEKYSILRGNIREVNPKLQNVIMSASNDLPDGYTVKTISGRDPRAKGTKNHPSGLAMDVQIYDNEGKLVPHNRNSAGWKYYEMLYRSAHLRGQEMYPEEKFIWGGAWISDAAGRGDPMHYQIVDPSEKGTSQSSGRYSFESGLDPSHPFVKEGGQLSAKEREGYDASVLAKIQAEKNASDPVAAAQSNMQQPPTELPALTAPEIPAVEVPALSTGGTVEMPPATPGEGISGVDMKTGKLQFVGNDRELYTQDKNGNLRVDPSTIRQEDQKAQVASAEPQRVETQNQPMQRKPEQPMPVSTPDPNFLETMSSGSMASSPSQLRALNRAKLYGENSGNLVNGHFT